MQGRIQIDNIFIEIYKAFPCSVMGREDIDLSNAKNLTSDIYILSDKLYAKCKDGILIINQVQKSGKNKMSAKNFINGLKL